MAWPVVEDGLRFDVHRAVLAGLGYGVPFQWAWSRDGEPFARIRVAVSLHGPSAGMLSLTYRCNDKPFNQRFRLEAEPCRFGGSRWFAICPATGRRAAKLYSLGGAGFHARHRYVRVAYRAQRMPKAIDRAFLRRDRLLFRKLKGDDPGWVPKPKWMRWRTYDRLMAQLGTAERSLDEHLAILIGRLDRATARRRPT